MRELLKRRWPDAILLTAVVIGGLWIGIASLVDSAGSSCPTLLFCVSGLSVESNNLEPGVWYEMELCIDEQCERAVVYANDSRDRSSDATSPTTVPPTPGVVSFDLSVFPPKDTGTVSFRIVDPDSGLTVETFQGHVAFELRELNGPDCDDPPCWNAAIHL